jgi:fructose-bisphosphate aldolase, class I
MLPRLNRLFAADGRCFDVAVDHGFFNEGAFLSGIEDLAALYSEVVEDAVGAALRLDAACAPVGMPLMVEPLAMKDGYGVDGDVEKIVPLVRQAVELGADVIKTDPTDDLADYHRVVQAAGGAPVLVRGGGRVSDEEVLARTQALMEQGAAGIVYGRNVIQHPDPAGMTRALMAVVHA